MKNHTKMFNALVFAASSSFAGTLAADPTSVEQKYIVQADSARSAADAVLGAGGEVERTLNIINGVRAALTQDEAYQLRATGLRLTRDGRVTNARRVETRQQLVGASQQG